MPVFELVTEPTARVDLSYGEIGLLHLAVREILIGDLEGDDRVKFSALEDFFLEILNQMEEAA